MWARGTWPFPTNDAHAIDARGRQHSRSNPAAARACLFFTAKIYDFLGSLFWVLESKRMDRSREKQDKVPMLAAPYERKELAGVDTDTRYVD